MIMAFINPVILSRKSVNGYRKSIIELGRWAGFNAICWLHDERSGSPFLIS